MECYIRQQLSQLFVASWSAWQLVRAFTALKERAKCWVTSFQDPIPSWRAVISHVPAAVDGRVIKDENVNYVIWFGLQNHTCFQCLSHFCIVRKPLNVPFFYIDCDERTCNECRPVKHCEGCNEKFCGDCKYMTECDQCNDVFCNEGEDECDTTKCNVCNQNRCHNCGPLGKNHAGSATHQSVKDVSLIWLTCNSIPGAATACVRIALHTNSVKARALQILTIKKMMIVPSAELGCCRSFWKKLGFCQKKMKS